MVKVIYDGSECTVVDGSGVYDWFEVKTGVKQGCCMSGFLFLLVVDLVMKKTTRDVNTGIRWKFRGFLELILTLLISSKREHIQTKVTEQPGTI